MGLSMILALLASALIYGGTKAYETKSDAETAKGLAAAQTRVAAESASKGRRARGLLMDKMREQIADTEAGNVLSAGANSYYSGILNPSTAEQALLSGIQSTPQNAVPSLSALMHV